jgi:hypothetical protein
MKQIPPRLVKVAFLAALLFPCGHADGGVFLRGDTDQSGELGLTDAVVLLQSLFLGAGELPCLDSGDSDDSGGLDLSDAISLLNFLFLGGGPPPPPYPLCGADPTVDGLGCERLPDPLNCPPEPQEDCGNAVGRALELGCGRVFAWGDEHVTYDDYWPAVEPFWSNVVTWLTERNCGGPPRSRALVAGLSGRRNLYPFLQSLGLEVIEGHGFSLSEVDLFIGWAESLPADPDQVRQWVEEGGALMTLVGGYPDGRQDLCDRVNSRLSGLGLAYDCLHKFPRGPVSEFGDHSLAAGLAPENAPFLNGTYLIETAKGASEVVARIGDCHPQEVGDCRSPVSFNGPGPGDAPSYEADCQNGPFGGVNRPSGEVELNIIGLYEPEGDLVVTVERTAPMVLVLSCSSRATWFLDPAPGTQIQQVIFNGYYEQIGVIPGDIPFENFDYDVRGNYLGAGYGNDCGGGATDKLVPALEELTGLKLRSFFGCYRTGQITLR